MRTIKLTRGLEAIIDDCDYDLVSKYKWQALPGHGMIYAKRGPHLKLGEPSTPSVISMHRFILGDIPDGYQIHHANGNGLDNRRENISIVTPSDNLRQRKRFRNNTSGNTGIVKYKDKWRIVLSATFDSKSEAIAMRQRLSDILLGR